MTFLEKLYSKYGMSEVHVDAAIIQMGHSPTSSTANRVLASMFSFGLLDSRGAKDDKFVHISKLAQGILLENDGSPRRFELLKQAAIKDSSMQEIWEKWGATLPSEDKIKKVLQLEMDYSPEGSKRFASVIVETYAFSQLSRVGMESEEEEQDKSDDKPDDSSDDALSTRKANLLLRGQNREVLIYAPSDLTDEEFDRMIKWLEFQKYGLVTSTKKDIDNNGNQQGE
jgi:hypothetical protein